MDQPASDSTTIGGGNPLAERRFGRIYVAPNLLVGRDGVALFQLLVAGGIVVRMNYDLVSDRFELVLAHPSFGVVLPGNDIPVYDACGMHGENRITFHLTGR